MQTDFSPASYWLIRPSVSIIPTAGDMLDFFQSSTRRSMRFHLRPEISRVVTNLDGSRSLAQVCEDRGASVNQVARFLEVLHERCAVEPRFVRNAIDVNEHHRILNFLGDYFPATEVFAAFERLRSTRVAVLGCGAVGSWTSVQLAHSGLKNFAVIDGDHVEESNLNRSIFLHEDIGAPKVEAIASALHRISPGVRVRRVKENVRNADGLRALLSEARPDVIVNCADDPSVDLTSEWINDYSQRQGVPYVIAGGYNLHLSLIGMTVSPGVSACFNCSRITLDELEDESLQGVRRLWRPKRNLGSLSPLTGITSSLAASEVLRLAVRSERLRPAMWNRRGEFNFLTNELSFVNLPQRPECGCTVEKNRSRFPNHSY